MIFEKHSNLNGLHAFLGASQYAWIRYDDDTLIERYRNHLATVKGTELHELAAHCIKLGVKLQGSNTLAMYVNDAIGYRMNTEQVLYYSPFIFGTADAICFRDNTLRIHDLKTGATPAKIDQLLIYAALFCLEYKYKPYEIDIVLCIYQNDTIYEHKPGVDEIAPIMDTIVHFDKLLTKINKEG